MHRSAQYKTTFKVPTKFGTDEKKADKEDDDQQKLEAGQFPTEVPPIETTQSNLREKFAEAGGFDVPEFGLSTRQGFAIPSTAEEIADAGKRWGDGSWQIRLLAFINSDLVQKVLVGLLVLDVTILFSELALDAFFPLSAFVKRDAISCCPSESSTAYDAAAKEYGQRLLGPGGGSTEICAYPLEETDYKAGYDYSKYHGIHVAHKALYSLTLIILSSFLLELSALVYLLGPKQFCKQITYVVDLIVVSMSLSLEVLMKHASKDVLSVLPGILIIFRLWRFVRIGHGLVSTTYELQQHKLHLAVEYIEELELEEKVKRYEDEPIRSKKVDSLVRRLSGSRLNSSHTGSLTSSLTGSDKNEKFAEELREL